MARKPRIHYEGALYHVIVRGNNKEYIFKHDHDKAEYLKKIAKYTERYSRVSWIFVPVSRSILGLSCSVKALTSSTLPILHKKSNAA